VIHGRRGGRRYGGVERDSWEQRGGGHVAHGAARAAGSGGRGAVRRRTALQVGAQFGREGVNLERQKTSWTGKGFRVSLNIVGDEFNRLSFLLLFINQVPAP
jgi:hypothetical protein